MPRLNNSPERAPRPTPGEKRDKGVSPVYHLTRTQLISILTFVGIPAAGALTSSGVFLGVSVDLARAVNTLVFSQGVDAQNLISGSNSVGQIKGPEPVPDVEHFVVPTAISDTALILMASSPVYENRNSVSTLISNREISKLLFQGDLLGLGVEYWDWGDPAAKSERIYHFTLPDAFNGETMDGVGGRMNSVTWAHALNKVMDVKHITDQELSLHLAWWYEKTFQYNDLSPVRMDPNLFKIKRAADKTIESIDYTGEHKYLILNQYAPNPNVPVSSMETHRDYEQVARPLVDSRGRLLLWLGVDQNLVVPEHFLKPIEEFSITIPLQNLPNGGMGVTFPASFLSSALRDYFAVRDRGSIVQESQYGQTEVYRNAYNQFINATDPLAVYLVNQLVTPQMSACEKADALRRFWQANTEWQKERKTDTSRPMPITLVQGGQDCNNLAVGLATLYAAAGLHVALVDADTDPKKVNDPAWIQANGGPAIYGRHLLTALDVAQVGGSCASTGDVYTRVDDGSKWILSSAQSDEEIGRFDLGNQLTVRAIIPFDPVTRNMKP